MAEKFFIENLDTVPSRFRSDNGNFFLEGHGYEGSIVQVDEKLANDSFVRRSVTRGKIAIIDQDEAREKTANLVPKQSYDSDHSDYLMESLDKNASERVGRYRDSNLPEQADPGTEFRAEDVWDKRKREREAKVKKSGANAKTSMGEPANVSGTEGTEAQEKKYPITERAREGDLEPDTGEDFRRGE